LNAFNKRTVEGRTSKGEQTRELIVETALRLFRERGYDATTMRAVAEEAGVSLGNAYYYFKSKEHLLHAYYRRIHEAHLEAAAPVLRHERGLRGRLLGVIEAHLAVIEPYHRFSGLLFRTAADPKSPLNPFHEESREERLAGTALFARVLEGSDRKFPKDLAPRLPGLLWTYHMGIVLFWIHDDSPGRARTRKLAEHTVDMVVPLLKLISNPLLRPLRKAALRLLEEIQPEA